jgi:glutamine amidotransferase
MCRWMAYTGKPILVSELISDSNNSLVRQTLSFDGYQPLEHAPRYPVDGDGFGIGWYDHSINPEPARLVFADPAWNNPNLDNLCHLLRTGLIFGHVRAASLHSPVSLGNCHPFKFGNLLFMHNGGLAGFRKIRRRLLNSLPDPLFDSISGTTDSEHCFALLLSLLPSLETPIDPFTLRDAVAKTINLLMEWCHELEIEDKTSLNFAVTDGHSIVATRFSSWRYPEHQVAQSLYYSTADEFVMGDDGNLHHCPCDDMTPGAVVICSEPLTANWKDPENCPEWVPIPEDSIITVTPDYKIHVENLEVAFRPTPPPIAAEFAPSIA